MIFLPRDDGERKSGPNASNLQPSHFNRESIPTVGDEAQMPFGGVKSSGYRRFGGTAAIGEFTVLRWITIEDPNQHYRF